MAERFAARLVNGPFEDSVLYVPFHYQRSAMLRCSLNRENILRLFGPKGFIANVQGKIAGYTWNLIKNYPLTLAVHELDGPTIRKVEFHAAHEFAIEAEEVLPFSGTLLEEPSLLVRTAVLDHKIPCLAFSLEESNRLNVKPHVL